MCLRGIKICGLVEGFAAVCPQINTDSVPSIILQIECLTNDVKIILIITIKYDERLLYERYIYIPKYEKL